jgi:hypothetical protein
MKKMIGIAPHSFTTQPDYDLIRAAGIEWLRASFRFPFADPIGGGHGAGFIENLAHAQELRERGFQLVGKVFGPGSSRYDPETKSTHWMWALPEWAGTFESDTFYETYGAACEEIGRQTMGLVDLWEIGNEPDIEIFTGPLSHGQVIRFLLAGARGIVRGNPKAQCGINIGSPTQLHAGTNHWLIEGLYNIPDGPLDYVGIDGYFGSWQPGGPESWPPYIDLAHELTGRPVLINEWGYASLGTPIEDFDDRLRPGYNQTVCQNKAFRHAWHGVHDERTQAEFIRRCHKIFAEHPHVMGSVFFKWGDDKNCWQCGDERCPAECAWGFVDVEGKPKAAYYAFKEAVAEYDSSLE